MDRITQVLEDGTVSSYDMDHCVQTADRVLDELEQEAVKVLDLDYMATVFSLFVQATHELTQAGWTTEELMQEVIDHSDAEDRDQFTQDYRDDDED